MITKATNIAPIIDWFKLAVPEPTDRSRAVQLGCHFEEAAEMIESLSWSSKPIAASILKGVKVLSLALKDGESVVSFGDIEQIAMLDSLCDQIVTAIGVAHMFGMDIQGALDEVNRSNYSKFVDGVPQFSAQGKIAKPATYSPPDLSPFLCSAQ